MKINICTLCDYSYLPKALSLYMCLSELNNDFTLHWLLIDEKSFSIINNLKLQNVKTYLLDDLENKDIELRKAKNNPEALYGTKYSQYCWTLTPYFVNYILKSAITYNDYLVYIDSDIMIYKPLDLILKEVKGKSLGIHTHRFEGNYHDGLDTGWFNVGIVIVKNDNKGIEISTNWKNWLLSQDHKYYQKYGKCGDQKYLDLIYDTYKENISVFDKNIIHAAPWCPFGIGNKHLYWYHFSHFNIDKNGNWHDSYKGEWNPSSEDGIKKYYEHYAFYNRKAIILINYENDNSF